MSRVFLSFTSKAWDKLAHALAVASANSSTRPAVPLPVRPTLQLLEDKGRWQRVTEGDSCVEIVCLNDFPGFAGLTKQHSKMKYDVLFFHCQKTSMQVSLFRNARMPQLDASAPMSFDTVDTEK